MHTQTSRAAQQLLEDPANCPLVIDLDGTLIRTDLLFENYFTTVSKGLRHHFRVLKCLALGKAALKSMLAQASEVDYARLPFNGDVLELASEARAKGRRIYLATASNKKHADAISAHLGIFDDVLASTDTVNLSGRAKAQALVEAFGRRNFDYLGNSAIDRECWSMARESFCVDMTSKLEHRMKSHGIKLRELNRYVFQCRVWLAALRVRQYTQNLLVFIPLATAEGLQPAQIAASILAFAAFSLCASAMYLLNDLVDLNEDRQHPEKKLRPLAGGTLAIGSAVVAIPILLGIAFALASAISMVFVGLIAGCLALASFYTIYMKRKRFLNVLTLAILYVLKVIGGGIAIDASVSQSLLCFSMFTCFCLALIKRGRSDSNYA